MTDEQKLELKRLLEVTQFEYAGRNEAGFIEPADQEYLVRLIEADMLRADRCFLDDIRS